MSDLARAANRPLQEEPVLRWDRLRHVRPRDIAVRFAFGAAISVAAGVIALIWGYRLAGLFLAFPAIAPASLSLLERKEGTAQAASDMRGAVIGAIGMIAFALVALVLLPRSPGFALPAALAAWVAASLALYGGVRLVFHVLGERQYLPEVPTEEAEPAVDALLRRHLTVAVAESCTGGIVAALLTNVPGAGSVFKGGVVAYSTEAKVEALGVPGDLVADRSPVSAAVAREMAVQVKRRFSADVGLSVTGLLGTPGEGPEAGQTYLALALPDGRVMLREYSEDYGPGRNRERDVRMALRLLAEGVSAER